MLVLKRSFKPGISIQPNYTKSLFRSRLLLGLKALPVYDLITQVHHAFELLQEKLACPGSALIAGEHVADFAVIV